MDGAVRVGGNVESERSKMEDDVWTMRIFESCKERVGGNIQW